MLLKPINIVGSMMSTVMQGHVRSHSEQQYRLLILVSHDDHVSQWLSRPNAAISTGPASTRKDIYLDDTGTYLVYNFGPSYLTEVLQTEYNSSENGTFAVFWKEDLTHKYGLELHRYIDANMPDFWEPVEFIKAAGNISDLEDDDFGSHTISLIRSQRSWYIIWSHTECRPLFPHRSGTGVKWHYAYIPRKQISFSNPMSGPSEMARLSRDNPHKYRLFHGAYCR